VPTQVGLAVQVMSSIGGAGGVKAGHMVIVARVRLNINRES